MKAMRYLANASRNHRQVRVVVGAAWAIYEHVWANGDQTPFEGHNIQGYQRVADLARTGIPRLFRTLTALGIPADAIGQSPFVPANPPLCVAGMEPYRCSLPRSVVIKNEDFNRAQIKRWMRGVLGNPKITSQSDYLCTHNVCRGTIGGVNTYYDHGHIGAAMSTRLASYFRPTVDKLLKGVR
jgi:hypothetical protein